MTLADVGLAVAGALLVAAGVWVLARNRAVGEALARLENDATRGTSLLNAERVERIQASVDDPRTRVLDRGKAVFLGAWLVLVGGALVAYAVSRM